ncbi:DNA methyltransferase [Streptomyces europaeiscabiei]|uniref:type ISP restriction/modification enzyme n=3 Tax=Streptomyces TaxID=1883 RepID=UPI0029A316E2|nr:type ISP restriction/modification enzyme [Streptomyces europaeiscabiei]MDX3583683.1 DNA methyltransferase [Streptomyces europaeiscabiei]MDX3629955.1 DNA methyltransferase [Streptomyces europaeiscabiei]MDX3652208.1 DNA methyltransferase [Streptomyces europaeiscabiei]WUD31635.1 DNA methyltransferase [Streptomyces europaeiscabiei]
MPDVTPDDAPLLADLMPWSVAPPRLGRGWPTAPDAASLKARWDALLKAEGPDRETLFAPTRSRTLASAVTQLPGQSSGTGRLARESGPCPEPVRVLAAPFDEQWLIPDHRLIDAARPELWRVADERQIFVVEQPAAPEASSGPVLLASPVLPLLPPHGPRVGRVRPLYRRPGGREPNLAPGLPEYVGERLGTGPVDPVDVLAWILVAARPGPNRVEVPLPTDPDAWSHGVDLGRRSRRLMCRDGDRPKLPGGRRPYVRAPLPSRPLELRYDRDEETLLVDEGRISPVPSEAWDFHVGGVRVLAEWFTRRTEQAEPGTLEAIRPTTWPQPWTSELLELITVLALLAELRSRQAELTVDRPITTADLRGAGVLPVPDTSQRPASVLDHHEEGPEGQFTLL